MIKVLIVEDEPPILRNIQHMIQAVSPDFAIAGCAYHGREALGIMDSIKPDVVISDIRMPVMDGLTLISHIKQMYPDIICVILTGYQEFEYAKKAIELGVFDYILKPLSETNVRSVLQKISGILQSRRQEAEYSFLHSIITREPGTKPAAVINPGYSEYILMLSCAGPLPIAVSDDLAPVRSFWDHADIQRKAAELQTEDSKVWVFDGRTAADYYFLFTSNQDIDAKFGIFLERLCVVLENDRIPMTHVISPVIKNTDDVRNSAHTLRLCLSRSIRIGMPQILHVGKAATDENLIDSSFLSIDSRHERSLLHSFEQGNAVLFKATLQKLFEHWQEAKYPQALVERLLNLLLVQCCRIAPGNSSLPISSLEFEINEALVSSYDYTTFFLNVWPLFAALFHTKEQGEDETCGNMEIMRKVELYINENYFEPITHQLLSENFGLVPSYLSKLFKAYKGVSPSRYLTALRIEKAKELLALRPEVLTKDIAAAVGYSDAHYFSRIFKKETGFWPSEYKGG